MLTIRPGEEVLIAAPTDFDHYVDRFPNLLRDTPCAPAPLDLEELISDPRGQTNTFEPANSVEEAVLLSKDFRSLKHKHMHTVTYGARGAGMDYDRQTHSLFVAAIVRGVADRVFSEPIGESWGLPTDRLIENMVLAALLHDIGHGPFSHGLETAAESLDPFTVFDHEMIGNNVLWTRYPDILGSRLEEVNSLLHPNFAPENHIYRTLGYFIKDIDRLSYLLQDVAGTKFRDEVKDTLATTARRFIHSLRGSFENSLGVPIIESCPVASHQLLEMRRTLFREYSCHPVAQTANALLRDGIQHMARERGSQFNVETYQQLGDQQLLDAREFPKHIARTLLSGNGVEHEFDCCFSAPFSHFNGNTMLRRSSEHVDRATAQKLSGHPRADMSEIEAAIRTRIVQRSRAGSLDLGAAHLDNADILVLITPDYGKIVTSSMVHGGAHDKFTCLSEVPVEHTALNVVVKKSPKARGSESQSPEMRREIRTAVLEALENDINVDTTRAVLENCNVGPDVLNQRYRGDIDSSVF